MILSIDPGLSGCAVVLSEDGEIVRYLHMPTYKKGKTTRVNAPALSAWIRAANEELTLRACFVEQVGARPGQGTSSMFNFGYSAGLIDGVVSALGIPLTLITPQNWKNAHGLSGEKDKDASRTLAARLYPYERGFDLKAKGQALADAVLMGVYGMKKGVA